jgi:predicted RecA/RadA family phage recombinase
MKNYIQPGNVIEFTATGTIASGDAVQVGQLVGIATTDAASGAKFNLAVSGVFQVTKATHATDQAWTEGMLVYWNGTAFTKTSAGNLLVGVATKAAASTSAVGVLRLNGSAKADEAGG